MEDLLSNADFIAVAVPFALFIADVLIGNIPDRMIPYIGITRRVINYIFRRVKK